MDLLINSICNDDDNNNNNNNNNNKLARLLFTNVFGQIYVRPAVGCHVLMRLEDNVLLKCNIEYNSTFYIYVHISAIYGVFHNS